MKEIPAGLLEKAMARNFIPKKLPVRFARLGHAHAWQRCGLFVVVRDSDEKPVRRAQRAHCSLIGLEFPKDVSCARARKLRRPDASPPPS